MALYADVVCEQSKLHNARIGVLVQSGNDNENGTGQGIIM